ncbi:MAG: hypothetical protein JWO81_2804 [Alphaproteobacteria bacterium]|nr:hypothetical protein [Alphaproteobacteria bacterium]
MDDPDRPEPATVDLGKGSREEQQGGPEPSQDNDKGPQPSRDEKGPIAPRPAR